MSIVLSYLSKLTDLEKGKRLLRLFLNIRRKSALPRLLLNVPQVVPYSFNGQTIRFRLRDTVDLAILYEIFQTNIYPVESNAEELTIFDVGGHSGFATIFFRLMFPRSVIYTFEPDAENFKNLELNLQLNPTMKQNIRAFDFGLGEATELRTLHRSKVSAFNSLYPFDGAQPATVQIKQFEQFLDDEAIDHIDLLKVDIEGGEYALLYSLRPETLSKIQNLFIEIHPIDDGRNNASSLVPYLGNFFPKIGNDGGMVWYLSR